MSIKTDINTVTLYPFLTHPTFSRQTLQVFNKKVQKMYKEMKSPSEQFLRWWGHIGQSTLKGEGAQACGRARVPRAAPPCVPCPAVAVPQQLHGSCSRAAEWPRGLLRGQRGGFTVCWAHGWEPPPPQEARQRRDLSHPVRTHTSHPSARTLPPVPTHGRRQFKHSLTSGGNGNCRRKSWKRLNIYW